MFYRVVVFALCIYGLLFCNVRGEEAGIDVFIKACQNQGLNNALIRTGFADIEIKEYRRLDIAAERLRYKQMIESQKNI